MFISKLELKNFKRFTELTIDLSDANTPPKLVLMIGANGSGKSCIFDAFERTAQPKPVIQHEQPYHRKINNIPAISKIYFTNHQTLIMDDQHLGDKEIAQVLQEDDQNRWVADKPSLFYGRSAVRTVPRLTGTSIGGKQNVITQNSDRPRLYIDIDQRFENDIDILAEQIVTEIFIEGKFEADELRKRYIEPINEALQRIFKTDTTTSLSLLLIMPPLLGKPVEIRFRKGQSEIQYDLLSSGEKEIINILLNLFVRRQHFQDTVYFIDELDVHLNTSLQYDLLKEITEHWIPDNCQLWTASHSLGFIQYAKESTQAVILDFDQFDFDQPQTITPQPKETLEIYEIAVPTEILSTLFKDRQLIFCENKNDKYYQSIGLENKLFIGVTDKNEVYYRTKNSPALFGLMDRDYLTDSEIEEMRQKVSNLFVLHYYNFENYLYHPENIHELLPDLNLEEYKAEITRQKKEQFNRILLGLKQARGYKILKDEKIEDQAAPETIAKALESDDFETFYPYFDMKSSNRQYLAKYNLSTSRLTQTKWFKTAISKALL